MRRVLPIAVAAAVLCASQLPATSTAAAPVGAAVAVQAAAKKAPIVRTPFALSAAALGTKVTGGALPITSDETAFERIGCTNQAGRTAVNDVASLTIPGLGVLKGVSTRVWTEKKGNTVSSYAEHKVARLVLAQSALGSLEVEGLTSFSRAFNANGKFGVNARTSVAKIVLKLAGSPAISIPIPSAGQTLTIPGLVSISLGKKTQSVTKTSAQQNASAIDVKVLATNTRATIAPTTARVAGGIKQGIFRGYSAGIEARGLADNLKIGRQPLTLMPCQGTGSQTETRSAARVNLGRLGDVKGVSSGQRTVNKAFVATATNAGRVADVSLLNGAVKVKGIVGVATVTRNRGKITRSSKGSTIAEITINGRVVRIPKIGKLEIPGLVKLEDGLVFRRSDGMKVVGLRITVLNGTGAVVDLGVAELGIRQGVKPAKKR